MSTSTFSGRSAIVTGAASGIGREIARQMARDGARVFLADLDLAGVEQAAAEITSAGGTAEAMRVDVAKREDVQALVDRAVAVHGRLDYIFNNAGVAIFGPIEHMTLDDWDRIIDVNLRGVAYGAALAYKQMVRAAIEEAERGSPRAGFRSAQCSCTTAGAASRARPLTELRTSVR